MASKKARELRKEFRKNGFIVVESTTRTYKKKYGRVKVELVIPSQGVERLIPKGATVQTHPRLFTQSVKQTEAVRTKFKVVRRSNSLVTIHRKNGTGMKLCAPYYWTGRTLRLLTLEEYIHEDLKASYERLNLPRLSHEQCVDIENALIRL